MSLNECLKFFSHFSGSLALVAKASSQERENEKQKEKDSLNLFRLGRVLFWRRREMSCFRCIQTSIGARARDVKATAKNIGGIWKINYGLSNLSLVRLWMAWPWNVASVSYAWSLLFKRIEWAIINNYINITVIIHSLLGTARHQIERDRNGNAHSKTQFFIPVWRWNSANADFVTSPIYWWLVRFTVSIYVTANAAWGCLWRFAVAYRISIELWVRFCGSVGGLMMWIEWSSSGWVSRETLS